MRQKKPFIFIFGLNYWVKYLSSQSFPHIICPSNCDSVIWMILIAFWVLSKCLALWKILIDLSFLTVVYVLKVWKHALWSNHLPLVQLSWLNLHGEAHVWTSAAVWHLISHICVSPCSLFNFYNQRWCFLKYIVQWNFPPVFIKNMAEKPFNRLCIESSGSDMVVLGMTWCSLCVVLWSSWICSFLTYPACICFQE